MKKIKRVFISADIEGVAGITGWDETEIQREYAWYDHFRKQMTEEVAAACRGALRAGAEEIYVKDGHHTAMNILPERLPKQVILNRGWSGDGLGMMSGIEEGYDGIFMIGYHSASYTDTNPLAHTSESYIRKLTINGELASEFHYNRYTAGLYQTPILLLTGDQGICEMAKGVQPTLTTVAVSKGKGGSSSSIHPEVAIERIEAAAYSALQSTQREIPVLPSAFEVEIQYQEQNRARNAALYPGAEKVDPYTVLFRGKEYFEVLRFFNFVL